VVVAEHQVRNLNARVHSLVGATAVAARVGSNEEEPPHRGLSEGLVAAAPVTEFAANEPWLAWAAAGRI